MSLSCDGSFFLGYLQRSMSVTKLSWFACQVCVHPCRLVQEDFFRRCLQYLCDSVWEWTCASDGRGEWPRHGPRTSGIENEVAGNCTARPLQVWSPRRPLLRGARRHFTKQGPSRRATCDIRGAPIWMSVLFRGVVWLQ